MYNLLQIPVTCSDIFLNKSNPLTVKVKLGSQFKHPTSFFFLEKLFGKWLEEECANMLWGNFMPLNCLTLNQILSQDTVYWVSLTESDILISICLSKWHIIKAFCFIFFLSKQQYSPGKKSLYLFPNLFPEGPSIENSSLFLQLLESSLCAPKVCKYLMKKFKTTITV